MWYAAKHLVLTIISLEYSYPLPLNKHSIVRTIVTSGGRLEDRQAGNVGQSDQQEGGGR